MLSWFGEEISEFGLLNCFLVRCCWQRLRGRFLVYCCELRLFFFFGVGIDNGTGDRSYLNEYFIFLLELFFLLEKWKLFFKLFKFQLLRFCYFPFVCWLIDIEDLIFPFLPGCYFLFIFFYQSFWVFLIKLVFQKMVCFESRFDGISVYICFACLLQDTCLRRFLLLCIFFFLKIPFRFRILFLFKRKIFEFVAFL